MNLRMYVKQDGPDLEAVLADIDARVESVGRTIERQSEGYWKIPELREEIWVFEPDGDPYAAFSELQQQLGEGWVEFGDSEAQLDEATATRMTHDAVTCVFLTIEYIDQGRAAGVLPEFELGQNVAITAEHGPLAGLRGRRATISGHAFSKKSKTWSYAIEIEGEPHHWSANEDDLRSREGG